MRLQERRRAVRIDRGRGRFPNRVDAQLQRLLQSHEKPSISRVAHQLREYCADVGVKAPCSASIYNAVARARAPQYPLADLPHPVRQSLYNVEAGRSAHVGGDQVVFYAFNYGSLRAVSFAAGLPWLCVVRAADRPGWRPKSQALLRAVMDYRGL